MNGQFDIIIIGTGAGGGTIAHALSDTGARILIVERGDFVPQEDENWNPEAVWKHLRYQTAERWVDDRGREFRPYTHYCVGGNTKFWGSVLYRLRREDFQAVQHLEGVSPAWPIDYDTLAPYYERAERLYQVRGQHGLDPTEPARGAYPYEPVPHCRRHGTHCREAAAHGSPSIAAAARAAASWRERRLHSLQHLQFVRVQAPRKERSGRRLRSSCAAAPECHLVDQRVRAAPDHQCGRHAGGRRGGRTERRERPRRSAALHRRRGGDQFGGAAAAVPQRSAPGRSGQFVRPGGEALHGASRDDDAGVSSVQEELDRVSEDRRGERLLSRRGRGRSIRLVRSSRRAGRTE